MPDARIPDVTPLDPDAHRKPTNVSLNSDALARAKALGINVSRACEQGLLAEIRKAEARRWLEENREALEASNRYVEKHGLPLAKYRVF